jgi:hypothetical protein
MKVKTPIILIALPVIFLFIHSCQSHNQTDRIAQVNSDADYLAIISDAVVDDGEEVTTNNNAPSAFPKYYTSKKMDITFPIPKGFFVATNDVMDSLRQAAVERMGNTSKAEILNMVLNNPKCEALLHKTGDLKAILIQAISSSMTVDQDKFEQFTARMTSAAKDYEGIDEVIILEKGINVKSELKYFYFNIKTIYSGNRGYIKSQTFYIQKRENKSFTVNINNADDIDGVQFIKNIR